MQMNTDIQKLAGSSGLEITSIDGLRQLSEIAAKSRYFSDATDAAQCAIKMMAGAEMGFGAFASMTGIHIIKGKPSIGANLMAAAVKRHPRYNYRVLSQTAQSCKIEFYELWNGKMQSCGISEFTTDDAKAAGMLPAKPDSGWAKFPQNMLFARAISNGVKWFCPDVFDAPVYTPEELGAQVDGEGNYVEVESSPVAVEVVEDSPKVISDPQKKRLFAIAKKNAWPKDDVKEMILNIAGVDSSAKIPVDKYDDVVAALEGVDYNVPFETEAQSTPVEVA
jgi:hypothetical protein